MNNKERRKTDPSDCTDHLLRKRRTVTGQDYAMYAIVAFMLILTMLADISLENAIRNHMQEVHDLVEALSDIEDEVRVCVVQEGES